MSTTTPPAPAAPPVIRADPTLRRQALLILAAAAIVWTVVIARGLPWLEAWVATAVVAGNTSARLWVCFGAGVLIVALAPLVAWSGANVIRIARRAAAAGQFPPPGLRVLRDTRVIEGRAAALLSRTYVILGALLLVCAAALLGARRLRRPRAMAMIRRYAAPVAILIVSVSAGGCGSMQPGGSAPPPLPTGVRASHVERTYVVRGTTGDEILRSLYDTRISAPGGAFQGLHSWRMRWSYRYAPAGGVCRVQSVEVQLQSETLVPRWEDRERADSAVAAWWDGYIGRLRAHENQHRAIAYQGAREVHRQLKRATSPTCGTMPARADELARRILNRYQARNEAYDEATQHGRTEGLARPDPPGRTDPPGAS